LGTVEQLADALGKQVGQPLMFAATVDQGVLPSSGFLRNMHPPQKGQRGSAQQQDQQPEQARRRE